MRNMTGFDVSGTGLTEEINTAMIPHITSLDVSDTAIQGVTFNNHSNIADIHAGVITSLILNNCPSVDIDLTYTDKS